MWLIGLIEVRYEEHAANQICFGGEFWLDVWAGSLSYSDGMMYLQNCVLWVNWESHGSCLKWFGERQGEMNSSE